MDANFFQSVSSFRLTDLHLRADNDFVDRLNYYYTSLFIVIFSVVVSAKQYVGKPLQCWVPAQFNEFWEAYAENYCWVKNTYFVPTNSTRIPDKPEDRRNLEINYYQYVPFILAIMALLFNVPNIFWKIMNRRSGLKIKTLVQGASESLTVDPLKRPASVAKYANVLEDALMYYNDDKEVKAYVRGVKGAMSCLLCRNSSGGLGTYLTSMYILSKLLFCVNVIGQLFLLNHFLSSSYKIFGLRLLIDLIKGREWETSGVFPRVTLCDFEIRDFANRHPYTVECVLMINLFNEKIFIFLWFLFVLLAVANIVSFLYWASSSLGYFQRKFISDYLLPTGNYDENTQQNALYSFTHHYLQNDGVFIIRLISSNAGHVISTELVNHLWLEYLKKRSPYILKDSANDNVQ